MKGLKCKDHTVSGEEFELVKDDKLEMLVTTPQPELEHLAKYYESDDYISHTDASKTMMDSVYQLVKSYALKQKVKLINSFGTNGKDLLDIGCGTGDFLITARMEGWNIFGIEPSAKAKDLFLQKTKGENLPRIENEIAKIVESKQKFDVITMWHVLEHVPNVKNYIVQLKSLLKPNGKLVIAVPNYKSYDASYYKEFWAAYDVPRHLWHFSRSSIQVLFSKVHLELEKTMPMKFDAYYVSLLSEKYKSGKSNIPNAVYRGFLSNWKGKTTKEYSSHIYILK